MWFHLAILPAAGAWPRGAYGLALRGVESRAALLSAITPPVEEVQLRLVRGAPRPTEFEIAQATARWPLPDGGRVELDRRAGTATITSPAEPEIDSLIHPQLGMLAAVWSRWLGRPAFHAAGFAHAGGAWAVVGDNQDGKSTLIAALAARGVAVVADDTLVIADGRCVSGPRCVDLRGETAARLGLAGATITLVRGGTRQRLLLPVAGPPALLRGWIYLRWADDVALRPISPRDRVARVALQRRGHRGGARDSGSLLELGTLPAWELCRPRDWGRIDETLDAVLGTLETA